MSIPNRRTVTFDSSLSSFELLESRTLLAVDLPALDDAYVRDGASADANFGAATELIAKRSANVGNSREIYLRFDTAGLTIEPGQKVTLRLFGRLGDTRISNLPLQLHNAGRGGWSESTVTWNNNPGLYSVGVYDSKTISGTTGQWYEWNVTEDVLIRRERGETDFSYLLRSTNISDTQIIFHSEESSGANDPVLRVSDPPPPLPNVPVPVYNSLPGAPATVYLDFNGDEAKWQQPYPVPQTPALDYDGNPAAFNGVELAAIEEIWARVAQAYAPFNINVTTVEPPPSLASKTVWAVMGGDGSWYNGGGVALGWYGNASRNRVYGFVLPGASPAWLGGVATHEAGHGFNLGHQSPPGTGGYLPNTDQASVIMGWHGDVRALWWPRETEAFGDMMLLANEHDFGFRPDDHGGTSATATALTLSGGQYQASGLIHYHTDEDWFRFDHAGGPVTFALQVPAIGAMLNARLVLRNAAGNTLVTRDTTNLGEVLTTDLPAGAYTLAVVSDDHEVVNGSPSTYGEVGTYRLIGRTGGWDGQSPFSGAALPVSAGAPTTIQIETYDLGGLGVAYGDSDPFVSRAYRTGDLTDLHFNPSVGTHLNLGVAGGDWLEYTVDVAAAGTYDLGFRVATANAATTVHLDVDGTNVTGPIGIPDTGSSITWRTITKPDISLPAGRHVLRLAFNNSGPTAGGIDWFRLIPSAAPATPALVVSKTQSTVAEGQTDTFTVQLASAPQSDVTVTVTRQSGDADLSASPQTLVFSSANWNVAQTVTLAAGQDADMTNGQAVFSIAAAGTAAKTVTATEADDDGSPTGQQPFSASPFAVGATPVTIQAEHFDLGGQNVAYFDNSPGNGGATAFRSGEDVDLKGIAGGGYRINGVYAGEWTEYSVDVATAGSYTLESRVSSKGSGGTFHVELRDAATGAFVSNLTGTLAIPNTGDHEAWVNLTRDITLPTGAHVLRLVVDSDSTYGSTGNFDLFKLTAGGEEPQPPTGDTVTLTTGTAAYVRNGSYETWNFGNAPEVLVKRSANAGNSREGWLKFDLSTITSVSEAKLRLRGRLSGAGSVAVAVHGASNTSWVESVLTWKNRPAVDAAPLATKTISGTSNAWHEWDVTSYLQQLKAAGATSVTFVLDAPNITDPWATFASDDNAAAADRPQLVVTQGQPVQGLVLNKTSVLAGEGALGVFTVHLAAQPAGSVTVTVARQSGDADLTASPSTLVFTPDNWDVAQTVRINAAQDADTTDGQATFAISAPNLNTRTITATEADDDTVQPPPTTTTTIPITLASYVRGGTYANTNFGTTTDLLVKRSASASNVRETYLKFDLSNVANITSAKLRLYGGLSAAGSVQVAAYSAGNDWVEGTITFNNKPAAGGTILATKTLTGTAKGWHEFDLTNFLKAEKAAGRNVVSIALKAPNITDPWAVFNADGAAANKPELVVVQSTDALGQQLDAAVAFAQQQLEDTVSALDNNEYPQYTLADGSWKLENVNHWTAGFLPGALWQMYQRTGDTLWRDEATARTLPLAGQASKIDDLTFRILNSFRPLYESSGSASHRQVLLDAAASKNTQWNETVGAFRTPWRSSDSGNPDANYGVLLDQSMDMELLFWAAEETGNQTYYDRAVRHLQTVAEHLVRPDGGTYHWVYFNSQSGAFVSGETYQGYSDDSTWARGQAWAIYSFTMAYRETGRAEFLAAARKVADYFIAHLPADHVPFWDFDDPAAPNTWRDSSAAAVAASGLLELSQLLRADGNTAAADGYRAEASAILSSLVSPAYLAQGTPSDGVLLHGALNVPTSTGTDSSLSFGDYYFLEAANRYNATAGG